MLLLNNLRVPFVYYRTAKNAQQSMLAKNVHLVSLLKKCRATKNYVKSVLQNYQAVFNAMMMLVNALNANKAFI